MSSPIPAENVDHEAVKIFRKNTKVKGTEVEKKEEKKLTKEEKKEMIIVSKIETLYLSVRNNPKYFSRMKWLIFFSSTLFYSLVWFFYTMIAIPRNKMYCFDQSSQEFLICTAENYCTDEEKGVTNYFYISNTDYGITDDATIPEVQKVNKKFRFYFIQEMMIYSEGNYDMINKYELIKNYFNNVIVVTYKENWNLFFTFRQTCKRNVILFETVMFVFFGYAIGNIVICYFADVFGRKKLLVQNLLCCGLCTIGIGIFSLILISASNSPLEISSFAIPKNYKIFEDLYQNYLSLFPTVQQNMQETKLISYYFSKYKLIFYLLLFFIGINLSSSVNISKAFILESSLNDTEIYNSYNYIYYGLIVSYFFNYVLSKIFDNFHLPFMIIGGLLVISGIINQVMLEESPRHLYEFFEYDTMTDFFTKHVDCSDLDKFYMYKTDDKIQEELEKNNKSHSESTFKGIVKTLIDRKQIKKNLLDDLTGHKKEIYRSDLIISPGLFFDLMWKNKHIRRHYLIIGSLIINIALIYYISTINLYKAFVISKADLSSVIIPNIFILTIIFYCSQMFFYFLLKFFGYNIILFICFFMIFIFSIWFQLNDFSVRENEDMNRYPFNSENIVYSKKRSFFFGMICTISFFSYGLFYSMYLYLTKYTKTIYRCLFYGLCQIIIDFTMIFSNALNLYYDKNMFFVFIASLIGFVNAYFVNQDFDYTIVSDLRKLELKSRRRESKAYMESF